MMIKADRIIKQFTNKRTIAKILCDIVLMIIVAVLIFWVLPQKVVFFDLASSHTTFEARAMHSLVAILSILFFRCLLVVYGAAWHATRTYQFLTIVVADMMAGVIYYLITEFIMGSVYPFILTLALFALIDIWTLFIRLGYKGLCEEYFSLQKDDEQPLAEGQQD